MTEASEPTPPREPRRSMRSSRLAPLLVVYGGALAGGFLGGLVAYVLVWVIVGTNVVSLPVTWWNDAEGRFFALFFTLVPLGGLLGAPLGVGLTARRRLERPWITASSVLVAECAVVAVLFAIGVTLPGPVILCVVGATPLLGYLAERWLAGRSTQIKAVPEQAATPGE